MKKKDQFLKWTNVWGKTNPREILNQPKIINDRPRPTPEKKKPLL